MGEAEAAQTGDGRKGTVWVPEMWGQEKLLKDWVDCAVFGRPREKMGCAPSTRSFPCAHGPDVILLQSDGWCRDRLISFTQIRLGSASLYRQRPAPPFRIFVAPAGGKRADPYTICRIVAGRH